MDALFIRGAAFPPMRGDCPVILGLRLRPLTLGHQALLLAMRSPFADDRQEVAIRDFFTAIFICSQDWRQAERNLRGWWMPLFFVLWTWRNRRTDLAPELIRFREWFEEQCRGAEFRPPPGPTAGVSRSCGAPSLYVRFLFLVTTLRLEHERALDYPVATATALYASWLDWEGKAELLHNSEFEELWEFAAREDAKRFNEDGSRKEPLRSSGEEGKRSAT